MRLYKNILWIPQNKRKENKRETHQLLPQVQKVQQWEHLFCSTLRVLQERERRAVSNRDPCQFSFLSPLSLTSFSFLSDESLEMFFSFPPSLKMRDFLFFYSFVKHSEKKKKRNWDCEGRFSDNEFNFHFFFFSKFLTNEAQSARTFTTSYCSISQNREAVPIY